MENQNDVVYTSYEDYTPLKWYQRLLSIFVAPGKLCEDVLYGNKKFIYIFILIIPLALIFGMFATEYGSLVTNETYRIALKENVITQEYYDTLMMQTEIMNNPDIAVWGTIASVIGAGISIFTLILSPFISAAILGIISIIILKIVKSETSFGSVFSVLLHATVISIIGTTLTAVLAVIFFYPGDMLSPALFFPNGDMSMNWYNALGAISVFGIWYYLLSSFMVAKVADVSKTKTLVVFLVLFIGQLLYSVGMAFLSNPLAALKVSFDLMQKFIN